MHLCAIVENKYQNGLSILNRALEAVIYIIQTVCAIGWELSALVTWYRPYLPVYSCHVEYYYSRTDNSRCPTMHCIILCYMMKKTVPFELNLYFGYEAITSTTFHYIGALALL